MEEGQTRLNLAADLDGGTQRRDICSGKGQT